jgi:hypothetical protein
MNLTMPTRRSRKQHSEIGFAAMAYITFLLALAFFNNTAIAQSIPGGPSDLWREPVLARGFDLFANGQSGDCPCRGKRCHLFRMPSAYPSDPVGLDSDNDAVVDESGRPGASGDSGGDGRLKLAFGTDNPFFDFRRPGDPGGVGYYRLHSQMLLFDNQKTGMSMGLQAVTPAGLEADGIPDGPTVLSPHFSWFHEMGNGTAIQGFVGKHVRANSRWSDSLERQINYGLALQSPLPGTESAPGRSVHLFLEALGRYRVDGDPSLRAPLNWELLPGVHWQLSDSWWMSGGLLMPLSTPRPDAHLWQITCSWHF